MLIESVEKFMRTEVVDRVGKQKKKRRLLIVSVAAAAILVLMVVWIAIRHSATVKCTVFDGGLVESYSESEKVFTAMSLSYLVYGCEGCDELAGSVGDILDTQKMGIVIENADISRTDKTDPTTAMIDSASFIRQTVGDYRFLTDLKDEKNSFYGAVFADDENKVVWLSYSGSVSFADAVQSSLLVVGAGLSGQEKRAFELYETVLKTDEVRNGYGLILTGHSLGGALATMVSYMSGAEAVTISGADGLALTKIRGIEPDMPNSYHISNYMTSPDNFGLSLKDCVQRMMFLGDYDGITSHTYEDNGMVDNSHCVFGFVRFENGDLSKPILPEKITE